VFFLDVGQGTCNVISIGNRQAIVIDTGREYSTLKRLLHKLSIDTIAILVISHCDQDHWGGAPDLLADTTIKTAKICFHVDHKTLKTAFWTKLTEMAQAREIDPLQDLIELKRDGDPHRLWPLHKLPATTEIKILFTGLRSGSDFVHGERRE
jgi:beta-lactamase superfamily II metal-dependent hydrolase